MEHRRILPLAFVLAGCGGNSAPAPPAAQRGAGVQPRYDAGQAEALSAREHDPFVAAAFDTNRLYAADGAVLWLEP